MKQCLQLNPYLPNFWWLILIHWWLGEGLRCLFLYFKTHRHTKGLQKTIALDLSFLTLSLKTFYHTSMHSTLLKSYLGLCYPLWHMNSHSTPNFSSFELTLSFTPIIFKCSHWNLKSIHHFLTLHMHFSDLHFFSYPI